MTRIRALTPDLTLLSGDDILTSAVLGIGGKGIISVASNVVPKEMSGLRRRMISLLRRGWRI